MITHNNESVKLDLNTYAEISILLGVNIKTYYALGFILLIFHFYNMEKRVSPQDDMVQGSLVIPNLFHIINKINLCSF